MGCSASRHSTFLTKHNHFEDNIFLESSTSSSPTPKALSLPTPLVHHPPSKKGDSRHLVSLTSTTYGSLHLIEDPMKQKQEKAPPTSNTELEVDPCENSSPDSVINTWELMEGLDDDWELMEVPDDDDFQVDNPQKRQRSSLYDDSFNGYVKKAQNCLDSVKSEEVISKFDVEEHSVSLSKPLWKHLSEELLLSKMDPNVGYSYRRALSSRQLGFKETKIEKPSVASSPISEIPIKNEDFLNCKEDDKIVLYYTSLRGIRKTYKDCCAVKMIFRGFSVPVDERDISMDLNYRKELQNLLNEKANKAITLPQVFIRGCHIGGVDEIRQLNDSGELAKLLEGFQIIDPNVVCETCGAARFVPCPDCNGSRKVFDLDTEQLRRCQECNENGLIRCPAC